MKNLTLKVALVAVATFAGLNTFAQTNKGAAAGGWPDNATVGDYVRSNATPITNVADPLITSPTDKVTVGKAMPFFVWPSSAYNPDFDAAAVGTDYSTILSLVGDVSSKFAWVSATGTITNYYDDGTTTLNANGIKNYVEISYAAPGNKVIQVTETPASGVCPGVSVYFGVEAIAIPSFTITTVATKFGLTRLIKSACWAANGDNQTGIDFTNNNSKEEYPYAFYLDYKIYNVDGLDAGGNVPVDGSGNIIPGVAPVSAALPYDNKVNGVVAGVPNKTTNPIRVVTPNTVLFAATTDFEVKNSKITVYEFDIAGYNAKISRKSDYVALRNGTLAKTGWDNYTQYGTPVGKYYIVALPTPVTGPIYHIANTFGL